MLAVPADGTSRVDRRALLQAEVAVVAFAETRTSLEEIFLEVAAFEPG